MLALEISGNRQKLRRRDDTLTAAAVDAHLEHRIGPRLRLPPCKLPGSAVAGTEAHHENDERTPP
jgi:hypothetical protein